ncbi:MAG: serine--tRNA ligase [Chloroflexi bacterium CG23_combo_of_CG06-09_8_20_14_all_45_10]|nr:MAG: serine--tRNA ligase [Chloroflexi bacterium CG23_combo_of_CG06-09_8_20_14_all_45_10]
MLDIKLIRESPGGVRQALEKRGDTFALETILETDEHHRSLLRQVELLRSQHNQVSKQLGTTKEKPPQLIAEMRKLGEQISALQQETSQVKANLESLLLELPNIPHTSVPLGKNESNNIVVRSWGEPREFSFKPLPHWELGEKLGIIDFQRGVKLSGTRFYVLKGLGAHLQRALISFMLDLHVTEHGYKEIYPPFMVKRECMVGSGNLPKFSDNLYHDDEDDFWFIPTAEVPLTNLHRDEILDAKDLPLHYVAYTACFRREKMAAGKDTRGIKRGHQFDKVELYKLTEPEKSDEELEKLVANAEDVCRRLAIPYRVIQLCTGDLGFAACKTYDIEMWAPGSAEWLEVSSCSNCSDFQARRTNIRYRPEPGSRPCFVHTLNGSGLALPRVLIAVLENYQQPDGTVLVPEVLQPYLHINAIQN